MLDCSFMFIKLFTW